MSGDSRAINLYDYNSVAATDGALALEETKRFHAPPITNTRAKNVHAKIARANAEREKQKTYGTVKVKEKDNAKRAQGISALAVAGALIVTVLMVFVVLAQIYYHEAARETVRLNSQLAELSERHRTLELAVVNAIDIREVERFARDELGMSRPDAGQMIFLNSTVRDSAVVVDNVEENRMQSFISFLISLVDYFR